MGFYDNIWHLVAVIVAVGVFMLSALWAFSTPAKPDHKALRLVRFIIQAAVGVLLIASILTVCTWIGQLFWHATFS